MPRPKGRGAARQNKGGDRSLKSAWAGGNYHNADSDASASSSDSELEAASGKGMRISIRHVLPIISHLLFNSCLHVARSGFKNKSLQSSQSMHAFTALSAHNPVLTISRASGR